MSRREVIRKALEEDWGTEEEPRSFSAGRSGRPVPHADPRPEPVPVTEVERLLAEYKRRRKAGHQAGCVCQSRGRALGCVDLRRQLARAGRWQMLYSKL